MPKKITDEEVKVLQAAADRALVLYYESAEAMKLAKAQFEGLRDAHALARREYQWAHMAWKKGRQLPSVVK